MIAAEVHIKNSQRSDVPRSCLSSALEIARAASAARAANVPLARWMMSHGASRSDTELALAAHYGCTFFHFSERTTIPVTLRRQLRPAFLKEICAVPVEQRGSYVVVVMADPGNLGALDQLQALAGKQKLLVHVGMADEIIACIDAAFAGGGEVKAILVELSDSQDGDQVDDDNDEAATVNEADSAVIKLANQLIIDGVHRGASDIHVEPNGSERPTRVRLRVDGDCVEYQEVPARFRRALVARIKITRLVDMGLDSFTFADSLLGILAQRLASALCTHCRVQCTPGGEEHRQLDAQLTATGGLPSPEPPWHAPGCEHCHDHGYRGRIALHELLVVDEPMRHAIGRRAPIAELRELAVAGGMHTLLQDGLDKARQGLTDLRQVLAVCSR